MTPHPLHSRFPTFLGRGQLGIHHVCMHGLCISVAQDVALVLQFVHLLHQADHNPLIFLVFYKSAIFPCATLALFLSMRLCIQIAYN